MNKLDFEYFLVWKKIFVPFLNKLEAWACGATPEALPDLLRKKPEEKIKRKKQKKNKKKND